MVIILTSYVDVDYPQFIKHIDALVIWKISQAQALAQVQDWLTKLCLLLNIKQCVWCAENNQQRVHTPACSLQGEDMTL